MRLRDVRRRVETDLRDLQKLLNRNRQAPRRDDILTVLGSDWFLTSSQSGCGRATQNYCRRDLRSSGSLYQHSVRWH